VIFRRKPRVETECFGVLASFATVEDLLEAVRACKGEGYTKMEAYTPLPSHEVAHELGYENRLPALVLGGGILGALTGFGLQYWVSVVDYPLNVGGRPFNSWPSFVVVTFETTILFASLTAVLGMLALNGLPRPHHPVFAIPQFELASRNRFFLLVMAHDPRFQLAEARRVLGAQKSISVEEVPNE
jgi:hypothetical protein